MKHVICQVTDYRLSNSIKTTPKRRLRELARLVWCGFGFFDPCVEYDNS